MRTPKSMLLSRPPSSLLAYLPDDVLFKVFAHLIHRGSPRYLYYLKHAIGFALDSHQNLSLYRAFFTRISFPSTKRYYGELADPYFLAWLVSISSDELLQLELPQVDPTPALRAARDCCSSLLSLSFFDSISRKKRLLPELLRRCSSLESLTIHQVHSETLNELKHDCIFFSILPNLAHLAIHRIEEENVVDSHAIIYCFSNSLKSVTIEGNGCASCDPCLQVFKLIVEDFGSFSKLQSLHFLQSTHGDLRKLQQVDELSGSYINHFISLIATRDETMTPALSHLCLSLSTDGLYSFHHSGLLQRIGYSKITLDIPGIIGMTSSPESVITSLNPAAVSPNFLHECLDILQLQHVDLGGFGKNEMVRERLGRTTVNARFPDNVFKDVKKVSIFVPCIRRIHNLEIYLDIIESILPLFPQLHSFEMSIHAVFRWKMDRIRRIMHLVQAKKPRAIVLYTDDLLAPYYAIRCPFSGRKRRYGVSEGRLLRLRDFITLLKSMESLEEVVMEGEPYSNITRKFIIGVARRMVEESEDRVTERKNIGLQCLCDLTEMERERDIDVTSVIEWLSYMVPRD